MYSDALPGYSELQIPKTQNCEEQQIREIVFHKYSLKTLQPYKCLLSKNKQSIFCKLSCQKLLCDYVQDLADLSKEVPQW